MVFDLKKNNVSVMFVIFIVSIFSKPFLMFSDVKACVKARTKTWKNCVLVI